MGKYTRLGKNTVLVFLGNAGSKLIGLLMLPLYTSWLSVSDYGVTDIINVYVTFLLGIVSCSISEALFIFPKGQTKKIQKIYFTTAIVFASLAYILYALFSLVASSFSCFFDKTNSFMNNIWLIWGLLGATMFQQIIQQFVRSIDRMTIYSITGIVLTVATAVFSFFLIPNFGVTGFVLAMICANICAAIFSLASSKAFYFFSIKFFSIYRLKEMLAYSLPLIPNGIMWWLVGALNRPIMENSLGLHAIGIFAVANKFPGVVVMVFNIFVTSWQISVLEEFKKKGFEKFYNSVLKIVLLLLFIVFLVVSAFSKYLVQLFATDDYIEAWRYISVLSLGSVMQCLSGFFGTLFSAAKKSKYFFYSSIWAAIAAISFNILLIPKLGIMGAAIATFLSFSTMAVSRLLYSWQFAKVIEMRRIIISTVLFLLIPTISLSVDCELIKNLLLLLTFIVYIFVFKDVFMSFIIKIIAIYDKKYN